MVELVVLWQPGGTAAELAELREPELQVPLLHRAILEARGSIIGSYNCHYHHHRVVHLLSKKIKTRRRCTVCVCASSNEMRRSFRISSPEFVDELHIQIGSSLGVHAKLLI